MAFHAQANEDDFGGIQPRARLFHVFELLGAVHAPGRHVPDVDGFALEVSQAE